MYQSKGFTLVEMIFVLAIIISLSLLTLPFCHVQTLSEDLDAIEYHVSSIINGAKSYSLTYHKKVDLVFTEHSVSYQNDDKMMTYKLPKHCYFSNIKDIYFNENGNINKANHIILNCNDQNIKLIFHLGSGDFYFEK